MRKNEYYFFKCICELTQNSTQGKMADAWAKYGLNYGACKACTIEELNEMFKKVTPENEIIFKGIIDRISENGINVKLWMQLFNDWENPALHIAVQNSIGNRYDSYVSANDALYVKNFAKFAYVEDFHGVRKWMQGENIHRDERGDDGFLLPAEESPRAKVWRNKGVLHRAELDRSSHKALPTVIIFEDGQITKLQWFYKGKAMTEDELTELIHKLVQDFERSL